MGRCGRCEARCRLRWRARKMGLRSMVVPAENGAEAAIAGGVRVFALQHLAEVVTFLQQQDKFQPVDEDCGHGTGGI